MDIQMLPKMRTIWPLRKWPSIGLMQNRMNKIDTRKLWKLFIRKIIIIVRAERIRIIKIMIYFKFRSDSKISRSILIMIRCSKLLYCVQYSYYLYSDSKELFTNKLSRKTNVSKRNRKLLKIIKLHQKYYCELEEIEFTCEQIQIVALNNVN